ncbi:MAG: adenylate/guanylate cyclase domain-containing protein [Terriglobia bacterium]|nr:MAG: adenylate/guanylate cyclase domain-containing protein [Terriglobia bacterium]
MDEGSAEAHLVLSGTGRKFPLIAGQTWAIGRGEGCAVLLDSRSVSRLHALIQRRDAGDYYLVDLGSRNGSFVNGRRVSVPMRLNDQDRLVFAEQELVFCNSLASHSPSSPLGTGTRNQPTAAMHSQSLATILVVDIRDFTPLARSLSEALLSQMIGTWFLRVGQVAQQWGSWGQQYIGDAIMAVWAHDRAANVAPDLKRALRALCEIDRTTCEISESLPLPRPLRIGAGINTGHAILGGNDYTALGDTVNSAFRLEAATKTLGLSVVLGQAAFDVLSVPDNSHFRRCEVQLKGYEGSTPVWAVSFADLRTFLA